MMKIALTLAACLLSLTSHAEGQQSHAALRDKVQTFVQTQTQSIPGKVSITVQDIDRRIVLPACPSLEAFIPSGTQLIGNTSVGVRCLEGSGWSLFVQVQIQVNSPMLVATHPLQQGQTLTAQDVRTQTGDLNQPGMLSDPAQAVGKVMKYGIGAGQVLRQDMLRAAYLVQQGKPVRIQVKADGFSIRADGIAMGNAAEGQQVQVRTSSGQMVTGTARAEGYVEITP